jgi:hypothetical protein
MLTSRSRELCWARDPEFGYHIEREKIINLMLLKTNSVSANTAAEYAGPCKLI